MAMVKKVTTRSDKPDDLVEGLDDATPIGGHKGWWNSFLGDGDKLDELKFGNKMVLLMDVLKESALIGDKVKPPTVLNIMQKLSLMYPVVTDCVCRCWCSASLCCLWT